MKKLITLKSFWLSIILLFLFYDTGYCQCQAAVNGPTYWVTTDFDGGPGSLRQAILDANASNTGGRIEINGPWFNFPIFSQLPAVTCDSLTIFDYFAPITIDGQGMVFEPGIPMVSSSSCMGQLVTGINFLASSLMVTNTNDDGPGSLRNAIHNSNFSASPDVIAFNIPGPSPHRIQVNSQLPRILKSLTIDGSTQPANGYTGASPKIEIDGVTKSFTGINFFYNNMIFQNNAAVYGLYIQGFSSAVRSAAAASFTVGYPGKGNVISNNIDGIFSSQDVSTVIRNNFIGTDTSGTLPHGNTNVGLAIAGDVAGGGHLIQNNVISGNHDWGGIIYNDVRDVFMKGNMVGTDKTGSFAIPNPVFGIVSSGSLMTIGGTSPGDANLFSGNCENNPVSSKGALVLDGDSITIIGNLFGTNLSGSDSIPNKYGHSLLIKGHHVKVGGATVAERNIFAGSGVAIGIGTQGSQNIIQNNYIGTDISGLIALPNNDGISISGDSNTVTGNKINYSNKGILFGGNAIGNMVINNEIQNNTSDGIWNWGLENTFTQNSISNNGNKGILNFQSSNNGIAKPVITFVSVDSVAGTSLPGATIELFYSVSGNFNAQGQQYISSVVADGSGNWNYSGSISNPVFVTSTQTDSLGNTSEFSDLWPQVTDNVWPGDCNYDLVVDNLDFLYLGMAMGNSGPVRTNASLSWVAQPSADWTTSFFSNINHKHSDTDGNGIADMQDVTAINQNYGLSHPFRTQAPDQISALYDFTITAVNDTIAPGGIASFMISAGNGTLPVPFIYGLKWTQLFDAALADTGSIFFDYSSSSLGNFPVTAASFQKNIFSGNRMDVAISRTNQTDTSNLNGIIAMLHIPVKQNITNMQALSLNAISILGLAMNGTEILFSVQPDSVIIDPSFVGVNEISQPVPFDIFPNPCSDYLYFRSSGMALKNIKVYDAAGKLVSEKSGKSCNAGLFTGNLNSGFYMIEFRTENGMISRNRFIKN